MIRVKSTYEGLEGQGTASGYVIDKHVLFCALPDASTVVDKWAVRIRNPVNGKQVIALVLDTGPWNEHDPYCRNHQLRPLAEQGITKSMKGNSNAAGIDLGWAVCKALGITPGSNPDVEWERVE